MTVGQAFGGDLEAVTVHSGLLAARLALDADLVIVTQGPGNLGTGTRWGFSGVGAGEAVNAAAVLRRPPVGSLRISGADPRARHRGVSHHSLTAYGRVALLPLRHRRARLRGGLPATWPDLIGAESTARCTLAPAPSWSTSISTGLRDRARPTHRVRLSSMGRGLDGRPGLLPGRRRRRAARRRAGHELSRSTALGWREQQVDDHDQGLVLLDRRASRCRRGSPRPAG